MMHTLHRFARWLARKTAPPYLPIEQPPTPLDAYRRLRAPSGVELLNELKGAAWTCASLNSAACAALPPKLYVQTAPGDPAPRCLTRTLEPSTLRHLHSSQSAIRNPQSLRRSSRIPCSRCSVR